MTDNIQWHSGKVTYQDRTKLLKQNGLVVWFTGLSGSGKSTIAVEVEKALYKKKRAVYRLDGDNVRHGLNSDLGFSKEDRDENIRRIAEVAALFKDAGLITLVCFISPYRNLRDVARMKAGKNSFIEVYVKCDIEECKKRDPKGLYKKHAAGELEKLTGVDDPYEAPEHPELVIDTGQVSVKESVSQVMAEIKKKM